MSHQITTIEVESPFGVTVPNQFYYHDPLSTKLMIMLPGRGYSNEHPVLFHLRYLALENGFDVLAVKYGFQVNNDNLDAQQMPYLQEDVRAATSPIVQRGYTELVVIGKSLGTPLAIELAQAANIADVSLILLTPIGPAMQAINGVRTLAVIGTADALYSPDVVKLTGGEGNIHWQVLDDLNHGLYKDTDWRLSVDSLYQILAVSETFIQGGDV